MRIITLSCDNCGTVVSANEIEDRRVMKCPGLDCDAVFRFDDLSEADRQHVLNHRDRYRMD